MIRWCPMSKPLAVTWVGRFAGALLRPHGSALKSMLDMEAPVEDVLEAAEEAGRQLINQGQMSEKTLGIVCRPLLPREVFLQKANQYFKEVLG